MITKWIVYYVKKRGTKVIDFHTHILPNIDDGAKSMSDSIELLKEVQNAGFETVILTSHYMEGYYEANVKHRLELLTSIKNMMKENEINIDVVLGNEIYIRDNLSELIKKGFASTIGNTKYVLFELPFSIKPINLYDCLYNMLQNGFVPILAHPERYSFVQQNPSIINDLIKTGVLMQANYGSFIGQYGKKAQIIVKKLLKNNMIHFLGTDVHRKNSIYNKVPYIVDELNGFIGLEKVEEITSINPRLVLDNKTIEVENVDEIRLSIIEKIIMKRN